MNKIQENNNQRLLEMGFIKGAVFRIVKRVLGMVQLRLNSNSNDIVIRKETIKEIEYVAIQEEIDKSEQKVQDAQKELNTEVQKNQNTDQIAAAVNVPVFNQVCDL